MNAQPIPYEQVPTATKEMVPSNRMPRSAKFFVAVGGATVGALVIIGAIVWAIRRHTATDSTSTLSSGSKQPAATTNQTSHGLKAGDVYQILGSDGLYMRAGACGNCTAGCAEAPLGIVAQDVPGHYDPWRVISVDGDSVIFSSQISYRTIKIVDSCSTPGCTGGALCFSSTGSAAQALRVKKYADNKYTLQHPGNNAFLIPLPDSAPATYCFSATATASDPAARWTFKASAA